jgi:tetratricopeptide (TPR) repeat protein
MLPDEAALSRQADALWLAGYTDNARTIWAISARMPANSPVSDSPALYSRALYNLALTAPTHEEAIALFERLLRYSASGDMYRQLGVIRFSRLLETTDALAFLDAEKGLNPVSEQNPDLSLIPIDALIDLEILRRRAEIGETARIVAETWMLLEQYPKAEDLYQWGAWYFNLRRSYAENVLLLKTAARHKFSGQWLRFHEALQRIREGNVDAAEELFTSMIAEQDMDWVILANLGRVLETRRSPVRALESYEKAVTALGETIPLSQNRQNTASRIQVRIALCLKTLGRIDESRRALEYALELNSDNLNARFELSRLD